MARKIYFSKPLLAFYSGLLDKFKIKMAAGIFNATLHSKQHFELKNSEFRSEIKF